MVFPESAVTVSVNEVSEEYVGAVNVNVTACDAFTVREAMFAVCFVSVPGASWTEKAPAPAVP